MVDWRAARVGSKPDQKKQGIEWYLERGTGQVRSNHPARTWVEGQEKQATSGTQAKGTLDVKECSEILEQMIKAERSMESIYQEERQKAVATINPGRHPSVATKSILRLVRMGKVDATETIELMQLVKTWLPPGWSAEWQKLVEKAAELQPGAHDQAIFDLIEAKCTECPHCQTLLMARCRQCMMRWCARCTPGGKRCEGCDDVLGGTTDEGIRNEAEEAIEWTKAKNGSRTDRTRVVNVHNLGRLFVDRVLDVRRTPTANQEVEKEGEALQFLAEVRGWQGIEAAERKKRLLRMSDVSLSIELGWAAGTDIFLIPKEHYPRNVPEDDDPGWWYLVKEITQCKLCVTCCRRKLRPEFTPDEWGKRCPAQCNQCKGEGQNLTNQGTGRRGKRRARGSSQKVRDEYQQCVVVQHVEKADEEGLMASRRSKRMRRQERENLADRDDSAA